MLTNGWLQFMGVFNAADTTSVLSRRPMKLALNMLIYESVHCEIYKQRVAVDNGIPRVVLQAHGRPDRVSDHNIV